MSISSCFLFVCSCEVRESEATVAVACKMLRIVWFMWTRREAYGNVNVKRMKKKLTRMDAYYGLLTFGKENVLVLRAAGLSRE
jgi:hypothetical protein